MYIIRAILHGIIAFKRKVRLLMLHFIKLELEKSIINQYTVYAVNRNLDRHENTQGQIDSLAM